MIDNQAYLGEAHWSGEVNKSAHQPLVGLRLFDAANAVKGKRPDHDGTLAKQCLLGGQVTCATCGKIMAIAG